MQFKLHLPASAVPLIIVLSCCVNANGQDDVPYTGYIFHPNQEVRVSSMPSTVAASANEWDVLVASVATAVMEKDVCCGRNSALGDRIPAANKVSLKELGEKLRGKHYLDSGLPIVVADQYWPGASASAEDIIGTLMAQHPLVMDWNGHLYVLYGAVFDEYVAYNAPNMHVIHTLLLVDTRFSDRRRYVSFDRQKDDWGNVSGLLALAITRDK
jgi:hypothetical protein